MESKIISAGTLIIKENEVSRQMYIIKSGKAKVFKTHMGKKVNLANLGPGEIFGELSFMDAKPRSASVIAATEMEVIVLDGEEVADKSQKLPEWIRIILKNVFYRFRELDQKLALMQTMSEGRKKPENELDAIALTYKELARYNKIFYLTIKDLTSESEHLVEAMVLHKEMEQILTDGLFAIKAFISTYIDHNILEVGELNGKTYFTLNQERFQELKKYIDKQNEDNEPLMLSNSAIAVLREMTSHISEGQTQFDPKDYQFKEIPLYEQSIDELLAKKILRLNNGIYEFDYHRLVETFKNQSVVKIFDQSSHFK